MKNVSVKLVVICISSVMAMTACERRERPVKKAKVEQKNVADAPKTAQTETGTGTGEAEAGTGTGTGTGERSGETTGEAKAKTEKEVYEINVANVKAAEAHFTTQGLIIKESAMEGEEACAEITDDSIKSVQASIEAIAGNEKDDSDTFVGCNLKGLKLVQDSFVAQYSGAKVEGVATSEVEAAVSRATRIVVAIENALKAYNLETVECGVKTEAQAPPADIEEIQ